MDSSILQIIKNPVNICESENVFEGLHFSRRYKSLEDLEPKEKEVKEYTRKTVDLCDQIVDPDEIYEHNKRKLKNSDIFQIYRNCRIPDNVLLEHKDILDWNRIILRQSINHKIISAVYDKLNWKLMSKHQRLCDKTIETFQDRLDWKAISKYQKMSEYIVEKFNTIIDFDMLLENKSYGSNKIPDYILRAYFKGKNPFEFTKGMQLEYASVLDWSKTSKEDLSKLPDQMKIRLIEAVCMDKSFSTYNNTERKFVFEGEGFDQKDMVFKFNVYESYTRYDNVYYYKDKSIDVSVYYNTLRVSLKNKHESISVINRDDVYVIIDKDDNISFIVNHNVRHIPAVCYYMV